MLFQKRTRLKKINYQGQELYFITICTDFKRIIFMSDSELVKNILAFLIESAEKYHFKIWAYCFMPDHLHFLIEGTNSDSNLRKFISLFKQKSGYWYKKSFGKKLWQESYYDHVLRQEENMKGIIKYIWENPVRKKLVNNYWEYPYQGSFEINFDDL